MTRKDMLESLKLILDERAYGRLLRLETEGIKLLYEWLVNAGFIEGIEE